MNSLQKIIFLIVKTIIIFFLVTIKKCLNINQSYINQNPQNKNYFAESNTYIKIMSNDIKNDNNVFNNNEIIYLLKSILNKVIK